MSLRRSRWLIGLAGLGLMVNGIFGSGVTAAAAPTTTVTIAGSLDSEIGCSADWQPDCADAHLTLGANGVWSGSFDLPVGDYEYKAALNDSWDESYGLGGGGGNIALHLSAPATVTFYYDPVTHWVTDGVISDIVTAGGDFQSELGCTSDDAPDCAKTWLQDLDGDGTYTLSTAALPAGSYSAVVFADFAANVVYGAGGVVGGAAIPFTVPAGGGGATTVFSYDAASHVLSITSTLLVQGPPASFGHPTAKRGDVMVNLFEWNWASVARECTTVLGPAGYGGVQVAPPQNSLSKPSDPVHPWWEVYQPVDYHLTSRMGDENQFKAMVSTCRTAGVKVYVDAVINHMTGGGGASYGGQTVTKYDYPGLYGPGDFHTYPANCPRPGGVISDFNNYTEVTRCELVGLSDLRTERANVRKTIAAYLNKLIGYGVSGFRVDAAKHVGQQDMTAIISRLHRTVDGTRPYVALEVPPGGPGRLTPAAFTGVADVLGFDFAGQVRDSFNATIADLKIFGEDAGLLPSDDTLVFVENHDTERNGQTLSYKSGPTNTLATQFMLAYGYGRPQVYASFTFAANDDSPPAGADGMITNTDCSSGWACTDRSIGVANLVDWHNYAKQAPVRHWYDNGANLISFSRGHRASFIAINNEATVQRKSFQTGLRPAPTCDIIHGTYTKKGGGACTGPTVRVRDNGRATITIKAKDSVAFDAANRLG